MNRPQPEPVAQPQPAGLDDLDRLAGQLTARGYHATVLTPHRRLPYLDVRNPQAALMSEKIYAQADWYFWSWAQRIAPCDQPAAAASIITRVLRADVRSGDD